MTKAEIIVRNFWTQADKCGIWDYTTGLPELLDALISGAENDFIDAIERLGYTITSDK